MDKPKIIQGGIAIDERGCVRFVNDFNFNHIKRFYMITNHQQGFVRAWHAHKKEMKYVMVVTGSVLIGVIKIDNWEKPSKDSQPEKFVLSDQKPAILYIPAGYANGFMSLAVDTKIIFFSSSNLQKSLEDDFRYPARYWNIWQVDER